MGKRGPKLGAKYEKRVDMTRYLPVVSDCQLVAAQKFNERLDGVLAAFDRRVYPAGALEPVVTQRFVDAAELLQSAIIGGIEDYETHGARRGLISESDADLEDDEQEYDEEEPDDVDGIYDEDE